MAFITLKKKIEQLAGYHEGKAQGRRDRSQSVEKEERGPDEVRN